MKTVSIVDTQNNEEIVRSNDPYTLSVVLTEHLQDMPASDTQAFVQAIITAPSRVSERHLEQFHLRVAAGY